MEPVRRSFFHTWRQPSGYMRSSVVWSNNCKSTKRYICFCARGTETLEGVQQLRSKLPPSRWSRPTRLALPNNACFSGTTCRGHGGLTPKLSCRSETLTFVSQQLRCISSSPPLHTFVPSKITREQNGREGSGGDADKEREENGRHNDGEHKHERAIDSGERGRGGPHSASVWDKHTFPHPSAAGEPCWVSDPDSVLSTAQRKTLDSLVLSIQQAGAGEIAIALMRNMESVPGVDDDKTAMFFAKHLHNVWGVGSTEKQDGVVVLLALENRVLYVSTGRGAALRATDEDVEEITRRMKEVLRQGKVHEALESAVMNLGTVLTGRKIDEGAGAGGSGRNKGFAFDLRDLVKDKSKLPIAAFVLFAVLSFLNSKRSARRKKEFEEKLARIEREKEALMSFQDGFEPEQCPHCLEILNKDWDSPPTEAYPSCEHKFCKNCVEKLSECPVCAERKRLEERGPRSLVEGGNEGRKKEYNEWDYVSTSAFDKVDQTPLTASEGKGKPFFSGWRAKQSSEKNKGSDKGSDSSSEHKQLDDDSRAEIRVRLERLREQYPESVSQEDIDLWTSPGFGGPFSVRSEQREKKKRKGNQFKSDERREFGGGSSEGGGGAGGSW